MGDFNRIDSSLIQRASDGLHLVQGVLVADCMHAVAQGDVRDIEFFARVESHCKTPRARSIACAMRSAVANAAEVMMSRLPAYAGR